MNILIPYADVKDTVYRDLFIECIKSIPAEYVICISDASSKSEKEWIDNIINKPYKHYLKMVV